VTAVDDVTPSPRSDDRGSLVRQVVYGVLAVAGAALTLPFNLRHDGTALDFVRDATSTPAGLSLSFDLVVLATACVVLVLGESRRLGIRRPWVYLVLCGLVAAAFAIPLFLLVRERALQRRRREAQTGARTSTASSSITRSDAASNETG
jgi:hypothetical protein